MYRPGLSKAFSTTLLWEGFSTVTPYRSSTKRRCRPTAASEVVYHPGFSKAFSTTLLWEGLSTVSPYRSSTKGCFRPATASEVVYNLAFRQRLSPRFLCSGFNRKDRRETFSDCKVSFTIRPKSGKNSKAEKSKKKFSQYLN